MSTWDAAYFRPIGERPSVPRTAGVNESTKVNTMNETKLREAWVGKHTQVLFEYHCHCAGCEADWNMTSTQKNPETYCPFCEHDEPISIKEREETSGGLSVA